MRLIDAGALFESIRFDREAAKVHPQEMCERLGLFCDYAEAVVKEAPTIDAVPVVRCKDCRHTARSTSHPDTIICVLTKMCGTVPPDFFCALGAKMDLEVEG